MDQNELDAYIHQQIKTNIPIFDSYRNLLKKRGNYDVDFKEFEWRYYRCLKGEEEVSDPAPTTFSQLPLDVLRRLFDDIDIGERLILRKVSKSLRHFIDTQKTHCSSLKILFRQGAASLILPNQSIIYEDQNGGCLVRFESDELYENKMSNVESVELLMTDVSTILANDKFRIQKMMWDFDSRNQIGEEEIQKRHRIIDSTLEDIRFHVEELQLDITNPNVASIILPHIHVESLRILLLITNTLNNDPNGIFDEIMETEHWKRVKSVALDSIPHTFPIENLFKFENFEVGSLAITMERLEMIRDNLLHQTHFQTCSLSFESHRGNPFVYVPFALIIERLMNGRVNGEIEDEIHLKLMVDLVMSVNGDYDPRTGKYRDPQSGQEYVITVYRDRNLVLVDFEKKEKKE